MKIEVGPGGLLLKNLKKKGVGSERRFFTTKGGEYW